MIQFESENEHVHQSFLFCFIHLNTNYESKKKAMADGHWSLANDHHLLEYEYWIPDSESLGETHILHIITSQPQNWFFVLDPTT